MFLSCKPRPASILTSPKSTGTTGTKSISLTPRPSAGVIQRAVDPRLCRLGTGCAPVKHCSSECPRHTREDFTWRTDSVRLPSVLPLQRMPVRESQRWHGARRIAVDGGRPQLAGWWMCRLDRARPRQMRAAKCTLHRLQHTHDKHPATAALATPTALAALSTAPAASSSAAVTPGIATVSSTCHDHIIYDDGPCRRSDCASFSVVCSSLAPTTRQKRPRIRWTQTRRSPRPTC